MAIPNKRELQQIAFNHSSDIDFQDFMHLYKKCIAVPYCLPNRIVFWLFMLLLHQMILYVSKRIFWRECKN